jgi:hypothetical protein
VTPRLFPLPPSREMPSRSSPPSGSAGNGTSPTCSLRPTRPSGGRWTRHHHGKFVGVPGFDWDPQMLTSADWANVVRHYDLHGEWAPSLGPKPGLMGSNVPHAVAHRFGHDVFRAAPDRNGDRCP